MHVMDQGLVDHVPLLPKVFAIALKLSHNDPRLHNDESNRCHGEIRKKGESYLVSRRYNSKWLVILVNLEERSEDVLEETPTAMKLRSC
ncbi:hypothetical protein RJT34_24827 [Clitoria ternatea]|uniref:Uncharacterized protein n=1 Tax=Clitoria ternatea TaxID=43366 RepID=A0AAN9FNX3_CLITE